MEQKPPAPPDVPSTHSERLHQEPAVPTPVRRPAGEKLIPVHATLADGSERPMQLPLRDVRLLEEAVKLRKSEGALGLQLPGGTVVVKVRARGAASGGVARAPRRVTSRRPGGAA